MKMIEVARLYRCDSGGNLKAFADVLIDSVLVKGVRVLGSRNGELFVSMPKQQGKDGKWYETVRLLDEQVKQELQEAVISAYQA